MNQDRVWAFFPTFFLLLSVVGLLLVPALFMQPNLESFQFAGRRSLVGVLFFAVCFLGVLAVFYPVKCRGVFQHTQNLPVKAGGVPGDLRIEGHHPNCQSFSGNRIVIAGRTYCAACSGLLAGAIIALAGAALYFFDGLDVAGGGGIWLVAFGEVCMLLGLVQIKVAGFFKVALNLFFVVGSFTTLAAVDALGKSLLTDLYVLGLILFFLWFRISLSEWNNRRICRRCQLCSH